MVISYLMCLFTYLHSKYEKGNSSPSEVKRQSPECSHLVCWVMLEGQEQEETDISQRKSKTHQNVQCFKWH